ncbi:MAG: hypothetical protein KGN16_25180 [Burkholderiales bacterium]|nr:hypothetical protein [Burkholderiales bacterium]
MKPPSPVSGPLRVDGGAARAIALLAIAAVCCGGAVATPTTWAFTGVIQSGYADAGQTVSGSLTLDLSTLPRSPPSSDPGLALYYTSYAPPYAAPAPLSGSVSDGHIGTTVGGGSYQDTVFALVSKRERINPSLNLFRDEFDVGGASYETFASGGILNGDLQLFTYTDTDGITPSAIFGDSSYANPDLSIGQAVNWFSAGSHNSGEFTLANGASVLFDLTSLTVTGGAPGVLPEPGTLVLASLATAALVLARRTASAAR